MKTLTDHFEAYERFRAASQMKPADKTINSFLNYCQRIAPEQELQQWMIDKWCARHENESTNSHYTRVAHINTFIRYIRDRKLADVVPYEDIKWRRMPKDIVFITPEELDNFFKALNELPCKTRNSRIDAMTWSVIFRIYYCTGLRPMEARELSVKDVDLINGELHILHTKGYREHLVAVDNQLRNLLEMYDNLISEALPNRGNFFVLNDGKMITRARLHACFNRLWYKYNNRRCVVYHFRHNYAIENINSWINLGYDQRWDRLVCLSKSMGHSKLKETLYYYSLAPQYANSLKDLSEDNLKEIIPILKDEKDKF